MSDENTVSRTVTVGSSVGLHARPAAAVVKAAGEQPAQVFLETAEGKKAQAASMLMVLALGAGHGDELTVTASGDGAQESVDAMADLIASDLDA
ncbi:HPr family phosphocarrier protein [Euzebya tangerina]|uniref:HPr family phosphocarrier protein n=1 Tax=Euzebya tangerina TaxID=591198 RepID=UPI000E311394|nr:HPr family phosphocarrier protein [Euzebya tangerina]